MIACIWATSPIRDTQRWLFAGVVNTIPAHPIPDRALIQPALKGDIGDRTGPLDHHLHYLILVFRAVLSSHPQWRTIIQ